MAGGGGLVVNIDIVVDARALRRSTFAQRRYHSRSRSSAAFALQFTNVFNDWLAFLSRAQHSTM